MRKVRKLTQSIKRPSAIVRRLRRISNRCRLRQRLRRVPLQLRQDLHLCQLLSLELCLVRTEIEPHCGRYVRTMYSLVESLKHPGPSQLPSQLSLLLHLGPATYSDSYSVKRRYVKSRLTQGPRRFPRKEMALDSRLMPCFFTRSSSSPSYHNVQ